MNSRIGMIEKDDFESWYELIEQLSELLWGDDGEGTREPFSVAESIERLKELIERGNW